MTVEAVKERLVSLLNLPTAVPLLPGEREKIIEQVKTATTASELAEGVCFYLVDLARSYKVADWGLDQMISPSVWRKLGVLFNPVTIPADGPDSYCVICSGSNPMVEQQVNKHVTYIGHPFILVYEGTAVVLNTASKVDVYNDAKAYVHGYSSAFAHDQAHLVCCDHAKGEANDLSTVHGTDQSFVVAMSGQPVVYAQDQAQLLAFGGEPSIYLTDSSRGFIDIDYQPKEPIQVQVSGECLLYARGLSESDIQIKVSNRGERLQRSEFFPALEQRVPTAGFTGTVIRGEQLRQSDSLVQELFVPRLLFSYADRINNEVRCSCVLYTDSLRLARVEPMDIDQLKRDLIGLRCPSMKDVLLTQILQATTEKELCQIIAPHLPVLVEQGVDGGFLRAHFTEETLESCLIHAFDRPDYERENYATFGLHQFFGHQLVQAHRYNGEVVGYERTVVVNDLGNKSVSICQYAMGLVVGRGKLHAHDHSSALVVDRGCIVAGGQSKVRLEGCSKGYAAYAAHAECFGSSFIEGAEGAVVHLFDKSQAYVEDQVWVAAEGVNTITAMGQVLIGYPAFQKKVKPTIKAESDQVRVIPFGKSREYAEFVQDLGFAKKKGASQGAKR